MVMNSAVRTMLAAILCAACFTGNSYATVTLKDSYTISATAVRSLSGTGFTSAVADKYGLAILGGFTASQWSSGTSLSQKVSNYELLQIDSSKTTSNSNNAASDFVSRMNALSEPASIHVVESIDGISGDILIGMTCAVTVECDLTTGRCQNRSSGTSSSVCSGIAMSARRECGEDANGIRMCGSVASVPDRSLPMARRILRSSVAQTTISNPPRASGLDDFDANSVGYTELAGDGHDAVAAGFPSERLYYNSDGKLQGGVATPRWNSAPGVPSEYSPLATYLTTTNPSSLMTNGLVGGTVKINSRGQMSGSLVSGWDLTISGNDPAGDFGWVVAGAGDIDGDGFGDFIVTAPGAHSNRGALYVIKGAAAIGDVTAFEIYTPVDEVAITRMGTSAAVIQKNVAGSTTSTLIAMGAPEDSSGRGMVRVVSISQAFVVSVVGSTSIADSEKSYLFGWNIHPMSYSSTEDTVQFAVTSVKPNTKADWKTSAGLIPDALLHTFTVRPDHDTLSMTRTSGNGDVYPGDVAHVTFSVSFRYVADDGETLEDKTFRIANLLPNDSAMRTEGLTATMMGDADFEDADQYSYNLEGRTLYWNVRAVAMAERTMHTMMVSLPVSWRESGYRVIRAQQINEDNDVLKEAVVPIRFLRESELSLTVANPSGGVPTLPSHGTVGSGVGRYHFTSTISNSGRTAAKAITLNIVGDNAAASDAISHRASGGNLYTMECEGHSLPTHTVRELVGTVGCGHVGNGVQCYAEFIPAGCDLTLHHDIATPKDVAVTEADPVEMEYAASLQIPADNNDVGSPSSQEVDVDFGLGIFTDLSLSHTFIADEVPVGKPFTFVLNLSTGPLLSTNGKVDVAVTITNVAESEVVVTLPKYTDFDGCTISASGPSDVIVECSHGEMSAASQNSKVTFEVTPSTQGDTISITGRATAPRAVSDPSSARIEASTIVGDASVPKSSSGTAAVGGAAVGAAAAMAFAMGRTAKDDYEELASEEAAQHIPSNVAGKKEMVEIAPNRSTSTSTPPRPSEAAL